MSKWDNESNNITLWTNRKLIEELETYLEISRNKTLPTLTNLIAKDILAELKIRVVRNRRPNPDFRESGAPTTSRRWSQTDIEAHRESPTRRLASTHPNIQNIPGSIADMLDKSYEVGKLPELKKGSK